MTTATTARPTAGLILAIDLGKYKSVACAYDEGAAAFRFTAFETSQAERLRSLAGPAARNVMSRSTVMPARSSGTPCSASPSPE